MNLPNKNKVLKTIINKKGFKTLIFAKTFEDEAYEQIEKLVNFEAYHDAKVRIMPDAHAGKGCVVGTTMTISDKVTPNLVGVDIGCGMLTIKLKNERIDFAALDKVIKTKVPGGFNVHKKPVKDFDFTNLRCKNHVDLERATLSIGSLGGGNHFIEVGKSETGDSYLIIHSGSRKLGADVCKYYQDKAIQNAYSRDKDVKKLIDRLKSEEREKDIQAEINMIRKAKKPDVDKILSFKNEIQYTSSFQNEI